MGFVESERGVSAVIGFTLVFAILVFSFVGYQAVAVPDQNEQVEFNHNQLVNEDVAELRSDAVEAAATGDTRSVRVRLGTTYPSRAFALNPAPPSGTLSTTNEGAMSLSATGTASVESAATLCGTGADPVVSHSLTYRPSYNEYESAPDAGYDNGVYFRQFPDGTLVGSQALFDGRTLRLRPVPTDYAASGVAPVTVDLVPTETVGRTTVTVAGSGESVVATIPSRLTVATWNELLSRSDVSARPNGDRVDIVIDPDSTTEYTILCEPIGVNRSPDATPPDARAPGGTGGGSATAVAYVAGTARTPPDSASTVVFALENTGSVPATIDFVGVESTNTTAAFVERSGEGPPGGGGAGEIEVALNTTGEVDENITIGGAPAAFDTPGSIPAGGAAEVTVATFRDAGGAETNMARSRVEFTLYFADGSSATYVVVVP